MSNLESPAATPPARDARSACSGWMIRRRLRTAARALAPLLLAACAGARAGEGPAEAAGVAVGTRRLPAVFGDSWVFLRATVGGRPALLLFDSGAGSTMLSADLVARLGLAERGQRVTFGLGATAVRATTHAGTAVRVGDLALEVPLVLSWPDAELPTIGGERAVGIIGADLLRDHAVEVDWAAGVLAAWDSGAAPTARAGDESLSLAVVQSLPVVTLRAVAGGRGMQVPVIVDYGSSSALILDGGSDAGRRLAPQLREVRGRRMSGLGGTIDGPEGRLDTLALGGVALWGVPTFVDTAGLRTTSLADAQGLLGTELLRRYAVVLDYARGRLLLRAPDASRGAGPRRAPAPFCRNLSGVCVERLASGQLRVGHVEPRSPAARAGLVPGDQLLSLDGLSAAELWMLSDAEIDARLDQAGMAHVAEVRRGTTPAARGQQPLPPSSRARAPRAPPPMAVRWRT